MTIRIHLMPETPVSGPAWACAEIRLIRPYCHVKLRNVFDVTVGSQLPIAKIDVVVTQRSGPLDMSLDDLANLVRDVKKRQAILIYDLDDDLLARHPVTAVERDIEKRRPKIRFLLREADVVSVSTQILAERVRAINPRVVVWANALDEALVPDIDFTTRGADIGYVGTHTHVPDLMAVKASVEAAVRFRSMPPSFEFCGISEDPRLATLLSSNVTTTILPVQAQYDLFHKMLGQQAKWKIGIAPLLRGEFNDAKSDIKALDYAAAGIAAVVADVPAYQAVTHDLTCLRIPHETFGGAVSRLLDDDEYRRRIAATAHEQLLDQRVLAVIAPSLYRLVEEALDASTLHNFPSSPTPRTSFETLPLKNKRGQSIGVPDRNAAILEGLSPETSRILEIGPSFAPIAPKRKGWNTTILDHASREELIRKYAAYPNIDTSQIETVDHVWTSGSIDAALPNGQLGKFDALIASHVIEHITNPIGFFKAAERVLAPGGRIILAVPDKRLCFDVMRPTSTTGQIIQAWRDSRERHSWAAIFDALVYDSRPADASPSWHRNLALEPKFTGRLTAIFENLKHYKDTQDVEYVDVHGWVFTPAAFELLMLELETLGLCSWHVNKIIEREELEFLVFLDRSTQPAMTEAELNQRRMELLRQQFDVSAVRW